MRSGRGRSRITTGGFTLVEAMVALAVFVIGDIACTETMGILNRSAAASRAGVAAQTLLAAKVNKLITTNYDTRDNIIPAACDPTTSPPAGTNVFNGIDVGGLETFNSLATDGYSADTSSFWGAVAAGSATPPTGTSVTLVADSNNNAIVAGTIYRRVTVFEAATHVVEVAYSIVYTISGRTFVARLRPLTRCAIILFIAFAPVPGPPTSRVGAAAARPTPWRKWRSRRASSP